MIEKVNLAEKLAAVGEPWQPKIVAELNDAYVKVVKFDGEFVWHHHDDEDELFWVVVRPHAHAVPRRRRRRSARVS